MMEMQDYILLLVLKSSYFMPILSYFKLSMSLFMLYILENFFDILEILVSMLLSMLSMDVFQVVIMESVLGSSKGFFENNTNEINYMKGLC